MATKRATYDVAEFKALPDSDGDKGQFEALVSVFGNIDVQGDRVVKGAFQESLSEWRTKGDPIPIVWSHDWGNPHAHIGSADPNDVEETAAGLKVKGRIDLDNPFASQVFRLMKERRVREFSFAYDIRKERAGKDGANELQNLGIIEVGPTLKGANSSTELLSVKSDLEAAAAIDTEDVIEYEIVLELDDAQDVVDGAKAGRRISRATQSELSAAIDGMETELVRLRGLLSSGSDDEKDEDEADVIDKAIDDDLLRYRAAITAALH